MKHHVFDFTRNAYRSLAKLPSEVQKRIYGKLREWEKLKNPMTKSIKLKASGDLFRFRVGDYRLICRKDEKGDIVVLVILKVGHRKDIYG
ncbi:MAG: type II toxin-antitoxin system RelE/ParE family toxin [Patescibacteria group bacterium]